MNGVGPPRGSDPRIGTAYLSALMRAAHQVLDGGSIYPDPDATALVEADDLRRIARLGERLHVVRAYVAARSRFGRDCLHRYAAGGPIQVVVVGCGLDTLGAAAATIAGVTAVYEVDHEAVLSWRQERSAGLGGPRPATSRLIPLDLERDDLGAALAAAGHDRTVPSFFCWLGVLPYLGLETVARVLGLVAAQPTGSAVVFDHLTPGDGLDERETRAQRVLARRVARSGEPFHQALSAGAAGELLDGAGLRVVHQLAGREAVTRYLGRWPGPDDVVGDWSRLVLAEVA
jgi:methyltransferase (TIGR00027 family)